jgi:hypothetical protein
MGTPLDHLIDATVSCTKCGTPGIGTCHCWDAPVDTQRHEVVEDLAQEIAVGVINYIDRMYPAMWTAVPNTARVSVRHTIINSIVTHLMPRPRQRKEG